MLVKFLMNFFTDAPKVLFKIIYWLGSIGILSAIILFLIAEYKKRQKRINKLLLNASLFSLLFGLYTIFYLVKILFAQKIFWRY